MYMLYADIVLGCALENSSCSALFHRSNTTEREYVKLLPALMTTQKKDSLFNVVRYVYIMYHYHSYANASTLLIILMCYTFFYNVILKLSKGNTFSCVSVSKKIHTRKRINMYIIGV